MNPFTYVFPQKVTKFVITQNNNLNYSNCSKCLSNHFECNKQVAAWKLVSLVLQLMESNVRVKGKSFILYRDLFSTLSNLHEELFCKNSKRLKDV